MENNWAEEKEAAELAIRLEPDPDKKALMEEELAKLALLRTLCPRKTIRPLVKE